MLFTILGELVYADPQPIWTASLIHVLRQGGFSDHAARQAIARGAGAGWITGTRDGRETRWELTPLAHRTFREGTERVFAWVARPQAWDGRWLVLVISVPQQQRAVRTRLYGALRWAGLGNPTPGLWLTPHAERLDEVARAVADAGLRDSAVSFVGELAAVGLSDTDVVARAWDLEHVADSYTELLARFRPVDPAPGDPTLLFSLELADALRHFPFADPQLPEALLPSWVGREVTQWFRDRSAALSEPTRARWREIIKTTAPR